MNQPQAPAQPSPAESYANPSQLPAHQYQAAPAIPALGQPLQAQAAPAPELPPYDLSPAEPAAYIVPPAYRRPFGAAPRDKRGRAWTLAFGAMATGVTSLILLVTPFILYGLPALAGLSAIVLGITALVRNAQGPRTQLSKKITLYAWAGILGGLLSLAISAILAWALISVLTTIDFGIDTY